MNKVSDLHLQIIEKAEIECGDIDAVLGDLVDNELTPTLTLRVREHIECCEFCKENESSYRWIVNSARDLLKKEEPALPHDVQARLREALSRRLGISLSPV